MGSRKTLLINPQFQSKLIIFSILITLLASAVTFFSNMYFFQGLVLEAKVVGVTDGSPFMNYLDGLYNQLVVTTLISTSIVSLLIIFSTLYLSNKIAGPIYQLKKQLNLIAEGDQAALEKGVSFRKGDFFVDLADDVNKTLEVLKSRK